ncbi:MAG: HD domain-containing phosphohydrolase, partial [Bacillota bacterium]
MGLPRGESHPDRAAVLAAIHPGDRKRLDAALRQALVRERSHWMDFRVFWPDGSLHWLSALELELIKTHAQAGYDILKDIRFPWPIARIVLEHHERLDGSGYPNGLRGGQILRESKILTVADVVEAMTSHRPYRPGLGLEVALEHIASHRGDWYEPEVVDVCLRLFRESRHSFG